MALGLTQPLTEMSTRKIPGGKGRRVRKADNLTAICEPIVYKMWEPPPLIPLWAFTACYRDSFTLFFCGALYSYRQCKSDYKLYRIYHNNVTTLGLFTVPLFAVLDRIWALMADVLNISNKNLRSRNRSVCSDWLRGWTAQGSEFESR
jgi:hypothetical protein